MLKFLQVLLLYGIFYAASNLLTVGLLLLIFQIKGILWKMDEKKWDAYFSRVSLKGLLTRFYLICGLSLFLLSLLAYGIFGAMDFPHPLALAILFFVLGVIFQLRKYALNKEAFLEKFRSFADGGE